MPATSFNLGQIKYNYQLGAKKWYFESEATRYGVLIACKGREVASKIAAQVNGSVKRCGALDNLARVQIKKLTGGKL